MRALAGRGLLEVDDLTWLYDDAVLYGLHSGEWQELEVRIGQGIAALARAEPTQPSVDAELLDFRRDRRLLAGEDLRAWLATRELGREDLRGCARRAAARRDGDGADASSPSAEAIAGVLRAEAIYDGTLAACAQALARCAAAAAALRAGGDSELDSVDEVDVDRLAAAAVDGPERGLVRNGVESLRARARAVLELVAAHAAFASHAASPERLARHLRTRRLDLTHVRFEELRLASSDAACEALMCVRQDGLGLAQIAARARTRCDVRAGEIAELEADVRAGVSGARPGDVVGPLAAGEHWRLLVLRERAAPSLADPVIAGRLSDELVARALDRTAAGKVRWHGSL